MRLVLGLLLLVLASTPASAQSQFLTACMASGERCITHNLWEDLGAEIHAYLAGVSLEDVVLNRTGSRRRVACSPSVSAPGVGAAA